MLHKRPLVALTLALAAAWSANASAGEIVVSAAASLTNAFKEVAQGFEKEHAGTKVVLNFGASDVLLQQIVKGAPADVFASADQKRDEVKRIAYGNPASVPVGRYTQAALQAEGLWDAVQAKSVLAQNVRQSLDYVARGEVDAGFVFATDAAIMPGKVNVAVRVPSTTPVTYPIALTTREAAAKEAESFVAYVMSPAGQAILSRFGFQKP